MSLIGWLLGRGARLSAQQASRLETWRRHEEPDLDASQRHPRYVVVDVESSGLDVHHDRLIAIGAVAVVGSAIVLADSFYAVLRQDTASSDDNILVHGIGGSAQTGAGDPCEALLGFLEYAGKAPLVGFHSPFDEIMIRRAIRRYLGESFRRSWVDLAWLAPALVPAPVGNGRGRRPKGLDDWMRAFGIVNISRHHAFADALATAQLLQVLLHRAGAQAPQTTRQLIAAADSQRQLERQRR
jgi:DNA polymerase-3 subunit epsilon